MSFNIPPVTKLEWIGIDLDNTIAEQIWPEPGVGDPIWENIQKLAEARSAGYKVAIHTARPWSDYKLINKWLKHHKIPFDLIVCGKLLVHKYIDDKNGLIGDEKWY